MSIDKPRTAPRQTRQRRLVAAMMSGEDEFVTAQEVHAQLREDGETIGLATVYRTLQSMVKTNELDTIRNAEGEMAYRKCSAGHHHHLICRQCNKAVEIEMPGFETWAKETAAAHGFKDPQHIIEIYGLCADH